MASATMVRTETQAQMLRMRPEIGTAATTGPFEKIAELMHGINERSINESAFLGRLSGIVQLQNDPLLGAGNLANQSGDASYDFEPPNATALLNGVGAFTSLWHSGLLPSAIVPSAEGGVGISLIHGQRQAHFEFSNDGDFSLIMFEADGEIEVLSGNPITEDLVAAITRAGQFLTP